MNELDPFIDFFDDMKKEILSYINDPDQITRLSIQSEYLKHLLFNSVTDLKTSKEIMYLHVNWLLNYPFLKYVDDNIVFRITHSLDPTFSLPFNLRKVNFLIRNYSIFETSLDHIIKALNKDILKEYTVRIQMLHRDKTLSVIIDNGFLSIISDMNPFRMPVFTVDILPIFRQYGISILNQDETPIKNSLILYHMKYQNNDQIFNDALSDFTFIDLAIYPNALFKKFLSDILVELNVDIVEIFKGYLLTGYLNKNIIKDLVYVYFKELLPGYDSFTFDMLSNMKISKYIEYIDFVNTAIFIPIYDIELSLRKTLGLNKDRITFHVYLIEPSILQLIIDDSENFKKKFNL